MVNNAILTEHELKNEEQHRQSIVTNFNRKNSVISRAMAGLKPDTINIQRLQIKKKVDLMDVMGPITRENFSWAELQKFTGCEYPLHALVLRRDVVRINQIFQTEMLSQEQIDLQDNHGNTALHLAAKLSNFDPEQLKIVHVFFQNGAHPKFKDKFGWRIFDQCILFQNTNLLALVFDWMTIRKKHKWVSNRVKIQSQLSEIKDFYCEISWECNSNWIPFLSKIAPSDNLQIWKIGTSIRLDFSLVGFQKLQNKRRNMTMIYKTLNNQIDVLIINRDREIIYNPLEDLDQDEKLAVLTDIINSDPI